jgi:short-subunit dehydrogenase
MNRLIDWLDAQSQLRPWWMNILMVITAFLAFVYLPWDFFFKPVAEDQEAWFGLLLTGWAAKLTEPIHLASYAAGAYGFWRMRPWMWPWAAAYSAQMTIGMFLWPSIYVGGIGGWFVGLASLALFGTVTMALWNAKQQFEPKPLRLRERYGDWALITGASAGLGAEFARAMAREGINCVLTARRADRLSELAQELKSGWQIETRIVVADLADADGPQFVAESIEDLEIGIFVNNAGFGYAGRFSKQDPARLREMIQVNCMAPVDLAGRMLPGMIDRARGAMIVVAATAGRQPLPLYAVYAATKAFDSLFGEALWAELREQNVDVTVLQPGPVATEFEQMSGEQRPDSVRDEAAEDCVLYALEALGRQPSVVSGGWYNWIRANANRFVPRTVMICLAGDLIEKQTPIDRR